jgi:hypothetical protein
MRRCLSESDVYPNPAPIPSGEEWYYELDGRTHGPLSRSDLEDLLDRSGETASEVRVRQGPGGLWSPFRPAAAPAQTARSMPQSGAGSARMGRPVSVRRLASSSTAAGLGGFWRAHWEIVAALGGWTALNALFLLFWPQPYSRERGYLAKLREIEAEVQTLRAKSASDTEWREFGERTRTVVAPIVSDLKKSASASEPEKQQLLWSARDLVPSTLGPRTKERDEAERRLNQYLDSAQRELDNN